MIKKIIGALVVMLTLGSGSVQAAAGPYPWDVAPVKATDKAALQNGAKLFVNYCMNCHSAKLLRYKNLLDLGLSETDVTENLIFSDKKIGDYMTIAMQPKDAEAWFGVTPPDLSLMARAKAENLGQPGTDYIYTYMRTFYRDKSRDLGWNNLVFPNAGMPNPFWEQAGPVEVTFNDVQPTEVDGKVEWRKVVTKVDASGYKSVVSNEVLADYKGDPVHESAITYLDKEKQAQFDKDMADLTAFLGWMAEPYAETRKTLGMWVMLFLAIFFVVAWQLNRTYWKHVR